MERTEAIEVIRKNYPHVGSSGTEFETALRELIPELKEIEDERIRNLIYCLIRDRSDNQKLLEHNGISVDKALAYLEKQKEQPTYAKSERVIKAARSVLNNWLDGTDCPDVSGDFAELEYAIREYDGEERQKEQNPSTPEDIAAAYQMGLAKGRNEQKPAEWSEEDEAKITFLERLIRYNVPEGQYGWVDGHKGGFVTKLEAISILKSLRPSWKPSEEQMEILGRFNDPVLKSLYSDLQKLL